MDLINYNPPASPMESDSSFEIVFYYDGPVITPLDEEQE